MAISGITIVNGRKIDAGASASLDQGINFGRGVFETIDVIGSQPAFFDEHLERLQKGLNALRIGNIISKEQILEYIKEFNIENCAVKILVTTENVIISTRENPYSDRNPEDGFKVCLSSLKRNPHSHVVYHKTINYTDNILEKESAVQAGFDEVIFTNVYDFLAEGSTTNIFFVRKDKLYTPAIQCGILNGIIRSWVITNFEVSEGEFTLKHLAEADEIFLTNSLMGIMPVRQLHNRVFEQNRKIGADIQKAYRNEISRIALLLEN